MSVCPTVWCDPFILPFAPSASGTINAQDECKEEKKPEVEHGRRRGKECRLPPPLSGVLYPLSLSLSLPPNQKFIPAPAVSGQNR